MTEADAQLDKISLRALTWKPGAARDIAVLICQRILHSPWRVWPDEIELKAIAQDDRQIVGLAWRQLMKAQIIRQTGQFRKSNAAGRHGGTVFEYELLSAARAKTFIRRNGSIPIVTEQQSELFKMKQAYPI